MEAEIDYTNHRGERQWRRITPDRLVFGLSSWHEGKQWVLLAYCHEKKAQREFAMSGIHGWRVVR